MKDDYSRKIPAARSKEPGFVKLTQKQWSVYYWLVVKSYWNSNKKEQHYFLYSSDFSYSEIKKELGIKDNRTIKSAMEKLELYNKINIVGDIIYIPHPDLYTYLSINLIKYLLTLCSIINISSELIVVYSILKRLRELDKKHDKQTTFNLKLILKLLGHNENDKKAYILIKIFISILVGEGLIKVSETIKNNKGGNYVEYTLWEIKENIDNNRQIDFSGEMAVEIQNRIKEIMTEK